jgi:hypothetical protein
MSLVPYHSPGLVPLYLEDPFEPNGSVSSRELNEVLGVVVNDALHLLLHCLAPALLLFSFSE